MAEPIATESAALDNQIEAQQARMLHAKAQKLDLLAHIEEQDRVIAESQAILTGLMYAKSMSEKNDAGKK